LFRLGEAGTTTYRVGERLVGVRTNDPSPGARLRDLLRAHVVANVEAPPNLSLFLGDGEGPVRALHRLYLGGSVVLHTRSEGRLLRAALSYLDGFAAPPPGSVRVNARLLVRDDAAVLVDGLLTGQVDRIERRLERLGYQVADLPGPALDAETAEVALWPPRLEIDGAARAALDCEYPPDRREFLLVDARLPIRAVVAFGSEPQRDDGVSPARRLAGLAHFAVTGPDGTRRDGLDLVRRLDEQGLVTRSGGGEDRALAELLGQLA
jgi:hypothetical protein